MGYKHRVWIGCDYITFVDPDRDEDDDELLFMTADTAYNYILDGLREGKLKINDVGVVVMNEEQERHDD